MGHEYVKKTTVVNRLHIKYYEMNAMLKGLPSDICAIIASYLSDTTSLYAFIMFAMMNHSTYSEEDGEFVIKNSFMTNANCINYLIPTLEVVQRHLTPYKVQNYGTLLKVVNKRYDSPILERVSPVDVILDSVLPSIKSILTPETKKWVANMPCYKCFSTISSVIPQSWLNIHKIDTLTCRSCFQQSYVDFKNKTMFDEYGFNEHGFNKHGSEMEKVSIDDNFKTTKNLRLYTSMFSSFPLTDICSYIMHPNGSKEYMVDEVINEREKFFAVDYSNKEEYVKEKKAAKKANLSRRNASRRQTSEIKKIKLKGKQNLK
jgi:hypothetical protein